MLEIPVDAARVLTPSAKFCKAIDGFWDLTITHRNSVEHPMRVHVIAVGFLLHCYGAHVAPAPFLKPAPCWLTVQFYISTIFSRGTFSQNPSPSSWHQHNISHSSLFSSQSFCLVCLLSGTTLTNPRFSLCHCGKQRGCWSHKLKMSQRCYMMMTLMVAHDDYSYYGVTLMMSHLWCHTWWLLLWCHTYINPWLYLVGIMKTTGWVPHACIIHVFFYKVSLTFLGNFNVF